MNIQDKGAHYFKTDDITIYHGNCEEILRQLPDDSVDFILTDPPYLVNYKGRWDGESNPIVGDRDERWLAPVFAELFRVLKPHSFCVSFYGWPRVDLFMSAWKEVGFRPVSHLVCVKNNIGLGHFSRGKHETAYLLAKGNPNCPKIPASDVYSWEREHEIAHPCQKPLGTLVQIMKGFTPPNSLVLDPFMGSGTTLAAARALGCRAIGIEIEESYCHLAAQRLSQQVLPFGIEGDFVDVPIQDELQFPTGGE